MGKCPSCGYCPHCGRKDASPQPYPITITQPCIPWYGQPNTSAPVPSRLYINYC